MQASIDLKGITHWPENGPLFHLKIAAFLEKDGSILWLHGSQEDLIAFRDLLNEAIGPEESTVLSEQIKEKHGEERQ